MTLVILEQGGHWSGIRILINDTVYLQLLIMIKFCSITNSLNLRNWITNSLGQRKQLRGKQFCYDKIIWNEQQITIALKVALKH